jgi:hypothetical protein
MSSYIEKDENEDGIDRIGFLKCMAWAGTGVLWMMQSGRSYSLSKGSSSFFIPLIYLLLHKLWVIF